MIRAKFESFLGGFHPSGEWSLQRLASRFTQPAVEIMTPEKRLAARLLSGFILLMLGFEFGYGLFSAITESFRPFQTQLHISLGFVTILLIAYVISRTRHYLLAALVLFSTGSMLIFWAAFFYSKTDHPYTLYFLAVVLVVTSLFVSRLAIILLTLVLSVITIAIPALFIPEIDLLSLVSGPISVFTSTTVGILLMVQYRDRLEQHRSAELKAAEDRYRSLLEATYDGICVVADEKIIEANPGFARMFGYQLNQVLGHSLFHFIPSDLHPLLQAALKQSIDRPFRALGIDNQGDILHLEFLAKAQTDAVHIVAFRDITEHIQAEEALDQRERLYRTLFESANDSIFILTIEGQIVAANTRMSELLGYSREELLGMHVLDLIVPEEQQEAERFLNAYQTGAAAPIHERTLLDRQGHGVLVEINAAMVEDIDGAALCIQGIARDISLRKQQEHRIERQVERLQALREVDRAITGWIELNAILDVLLNQMTEKLGVDGGAVLMLDESMENLHMVRQGGLLPRGLNGRPISVQGDNPGDAVRQRRMVHNPDLGNCCVLSPRMQSAFTGGYRGYIGVPLIAKDQVKGVLEIYHREPLNPDQDWLDFLDALASQAAIAIDHAALFSELQHSNEELSAAYDATLEGWAKALELRDKETEGHSRRVTELTVMLAGALHMSKEKLIHVRRGALLHDIGKMGIPDHILLKPGPLTDSEWEVMRQHPRLSYEMLRGIAYLEPALTIPYSHHERWDGSGYPRGLKAEQIPLEARIFAIVDVWDALLSDRPYRKAWPLAKVIDTIQAEKGSHFDPQVVEAFLAVTRTLSSQNFLPAAARNPLA